MKKEEGTEVKNVCILPRPCSRTPLRALPSVNSSPWSHNSLFTIKDVCWVEGSRDSPLPSAPSLSSLSSLQCNKICICTSLNCKRSCALEQACVHNPQFPSACTWLCLCWKQRQCGAGNCPASRIFPSVAGREVWPGQSCSIPHPPADHPALPPCCPEACTQQGRYFYWKEYEIKRYDFFRSGWAAHESAKHEVWTMKDLLFYCNPLNRMYEHLSSLKGLVKCSLEVQN